MVNTKKFSEFNAINTSGTNSLVGLSNGNNAISDFPLSWTTAQRPVAPTDGTLGYNTDIKEYEFWNTLTSLWTQLASGGVGVTDIFTGTGLTGGPITSVGTISFAPIAATSFWANTTGGVAVPTVTSLSTILQTANNLSELIPTAATARVNLGLAIGTNVEAWSAILDQISAGVWTGATSITTLGTITTGTWHGTPVSVPFGGTGNTTFTAYSVICAGVTATGAFQNVSGVGTAGQVLTSNGAGTLPSWQSTGSGNVNPGLINQVAYYAAAGSTISGLATANNGVLVTSAGGVPSISSTLPAAVQGNITAVGTVTSGVWQGTPVAMAFGGTNANLTATVNNLVYSTATQLALLATGNNSVLVTSNTGVPSISNILPALVQGNITALGTIASGTWNGNVISVPFGGTGASSFTAFSILAAGTTSTGAFQNVSGTGLIGQVLTSQGAGALPQWANATGTGTVNSGGINDLAYYAAAGTTISGLATGNNGILVTSNTGVPSISTTLPNAVQLNITTVGTITTGLWNGSTITVPFGGTGNTTFTAFSVICAGTTATGAFQNVSGVGLSGQVLTSQGAGALPQWANATGTGTVNSGAINDLAYYAAAGNTISGLATANGGTLVTDNTGVPSILPATGTTGNILQTVASGTPAWSNAAYPVSTTINQILYSNATNTVTGLATANSGVLVTSGTGVPSILAAGTTGQVLQASTAGTPAWSTPTYPTGSATAGLFIVSDGTNFVASAKPAFTTINVQTFTSTGTYTPTSGMKYCIIECIGPGGAGGGVASSSGEGGGGGGGGGGYSRKFATAATVGASQAVTVGTGGVAGTAGNNKGGDGSGATSVGTICIANQGIGGGGAAANSSGQGGAGGSAGTGDVALAGHPGFNGLGGSVTTIQCFGGSGGYGHFGGGGLAKVGVGTGNAATGKGAGGSGGCDVSSGGNRQGGAGTDGYVVITEFIYA